MTKKLKKFRLKTRTIEEKFCLIEAENEEQAKIIWKGKRLWNEDDEESIVINTDNRIIGISDLSNHYNYD